MLHSQDQARRLEEELAATKKRYETVSGRSQINKWDICVSHKAHVQATRPEVRGQRSRVQYGGCNWGFCCNQACRCARCGVAKVGCRLPTNVHLGFYSQFVGGGWGCLCGYKYWLVMPSLAHAGPLACAHHARVNLSAGVCFTPSFTLALTLPPTPLPTCHPHPHPHSPSQPHTLTLLPAGPRGGCPPGHSCSQAKGASGGPSGEPGFPNGTVNSIGSS